MTQLETNLQKILIDKNTNLLPENLKTGITCLGVTGTYEGGIDTSDATATANDIISPKTAYANGEKIEGNIELIEKVPLSGKLYYSKTIRKGHCSLYDVYAVDDIIMFVSVADGNLDCTILKDNVIIKEQSFDISSVFSFTTIDAIALNLVQNTTSQVIFEVGAAYMEGATYYYSFNTLTINSDEDSLTLGTNISVTDTDHHQGTINTLWAVKTIPGRFVSIVKKNSDDIFQYITTDWATNEATVSYANLYHGSYYDPTNVNITGNYKWLIQPKFAQYLNPDTLTITKYTNSDSTKHVYISPNNKYMFVNNVLYKITFNTNYETMCSSRVSIMDITANAVYFTEDEKYIYAETSSGIDIYEIIEGTITFRQNVLYSECTILPLNSGTSFLMFDLVNNEILLYYISTQELILEGLIREGQNFIRLEKADIPVTTGVLEDISYKNQNGDYIIRYYA